MPKKYALVIGIEDYPQDSGLSTVPYAVNDCNAIYGYLKNTASFDVSKPILNEEAVFGKIGDSIYNLFNYVQPEDWVLIYFAGHGHNSDYGGLFVPYDFDSSKTYNDYSCIPFNTFNKYLGKKNPKNFILFIDACHSGYATADVRGVSAGNLAEDITGLPDSVHNAFEEQSQKLISDDYADESTSRVLFTSCGPGEKSHPSHENKHGLFTYYLLQGLSYYGPGTADSVSLDNLIAWVKEKVTERAKLKGFVQNPKSKTNMGTIELPLRNVDTPHRHSPPPQAEDQIKFARDHLNNKEYDEAIKAASEIKNIDPLNSDADDIIRTAKEEKNRKIKRIQEENRLAFNEWLKRANNFINNQEWEKAFSCLEKAKGIYPDDNRLAGLYQRIELFRNPQAQDTQQQLESLFNSYQESIKGKNFFDALQCLDQILIIYPDNIKAKDERKKNLEIYAENVIGNHLKHCISDVNEEIEKNSEWLAQTNKEIQKYEAVGMVNEAKEAKKRAFEVSRKN